MGKSLKNSLFLLFLFLTNHVVLAQTYIVEETCDPSTLDYVEPLNNYTVFAIFILLVPILLAQRGYYHITRKRSPTADEVEKGLPKLKIRALRAIVMYLITPLIIGYFVVSRRETLHLEGWYLLLVMYAYLVFAVWDARSRRKKIFNTLFGNLSESEWYLRRIAVRLNGWDNALFFPIPFVWLKIKDDRAIRRALKHSRK